MGTVTRLVREPLSDEEARKRIKALWKEGSVKNEWPADQHLAEAWLFAVDVEHVVRFGSVKGHRFVTSRWIYRLEGETPDGDMLACEFTIERNRLILEDVDSPRLSLREE